jgi:eukaryotic-like serine/threonine-protein kinase
MSLKAKESFQFGEFRLDPAARTLWRADAAVALNRRAFDVLLYLVQNPGDVITRGDLLKNVWPDAFVDENSLSQSISALRRALDQKPDEHSYIATVPGRGYQFTCPVHRIASEAATEIEPLSPPPQHHDSLPEQTIFGLQSITKHTQTVEEETVVPHRRPWRSRRVALWSCIGVVVAVLVTVAGLRFARPPSYGHAAAVIADLENETGDAEFDRSLNRMLQIDLGQSPYFTIVGEGREREVLKTMRKPDGERITAPLAREICQRLNGQVYVTPAIAKVGDRYLLTLEANDCADGHSLGAAQKEALSKSQVLATLAVLIRQVRRNAGESRASIQPINKPLFNEPTASLDALKDYTEAGRFSDLGKYSEAIALYRHAIELDPNFTMAYADLSSMYLNIGDHVHDTEAITKAYSLRETVNQAERLYIESRYHQSVTGDLHAQLDALRQWAGSDWRETAPLASLINFESGIGQRSNAAADADRLVDLLKGAYALQPGAFSEHGSTGNTFFEHAAIFYEIVMRAYYQANLPDKLRAQYAEAQQWKAENGGLHGIMLDFSADNGDDAGRAASLTRATSCSTRLWRRSPGARWGARKDYLYRPQSRPSVTSFRTPSPTSMTITRAFWSSSAW